MKMAIKIGKEVIEGERINPSVLGLTNTQFRQFAELGKIPGFILFPNGAMEIWIEQKPFATQKQLANQLKTIKNGLKKIEKFAERLRQRLVFDKIPKEVIISTGSDDPEELCPFCSRKTYLSE